MGNTTSHTIVEPVNYDCQICMKTEKLPNIAGRFFIINSTECKCNGCGTIFPKKQIYKSFLNEIKN